MAISTLSKNENLFTEYPSNADNYFTQREIILLKLPKSMCPDFESTSTSLHITSCKQYSDYIQNEITFWEAHDPERKLAEYTRIQNLKSAKNEFLQAIELYNASPNDTSSGDYRMSQSIGQLSSGHLSSKTRLSKQCLKNIHKSKNYFTGFMTCFTTNRSNSVPSSVDALEGFIAALEYCKIIRQLVAASGDDILNFNEAANKAHENFARLNERYTIAYHDHETSIRDFSDQMDKQFQNLTNEAQEYFREKERRCNELETLYAEKLKLQEPAKYWAEMDTKYTNRGRFWLGASISFAILLVGALVAILIYLPNLFSEGSHWLEVFKNSAIITVITSIAVYLLRLFVKLSTSSFHLASDACERNKLTYFYLALIEKKAVTEKERAIILNSLFSRADTGMLKGDATPTMSANISELVQNLGKN